VWDSKTIKSLRFMDICRYSNKPTAVVSRAEPAAGRKGNGAQRMVNVIVEIPTGAAITFLLAYIYVFYPPYQVKFPRPNQTHSTVLEIKFIAEAWPFGFSLDAHQVPATCSYPLIGCNSSSIRVIESCF
jgi:hypothetical protein